MYAPPVSLSSTFGQDLESSLKEIDAIGEGITVYDIQDWFLTSLAEAKLAATQEMLIFFAFCIKISLVPTVMIKSTMLKYIPEAMKNNQKMVVNGLPTATTLRLMGQILIDSEALIGDMPSTYATINMKGTIFHPVPGTAYGDICKEWRESHKDHEVDSFFKQELLLYISDCKEEIEVNVDRAKNSRKSYSARIAARFTRKK